MARIEWVEERLERWAEWSLRKGAPSGTLPMFKGGADFVSRTLAGLHLDETECWKTAKDIAALPDPLGQTVTVYYQSGSMAAQDRLTISRAVLSQRLDRAHRALASVWLVSGNTDDQLPGSFTPLTK